MVPLSRATWPRGPLHAGSRPEQDVSLHPHQLHPAVGEAQKRRRVPGVAEGERPATSVLSVAGPCRNRQLRPTDSARP